MSALTDLVLFDRNLADSFDRTNRAATSGSGALINIAAAEAARRQALEDEGRKRVFGLQDEERKRVFGLQDEERLLEQQIAAERRKIDNALEEKRRLALQEPELFKAREPIRRATTEENRANELRLALEKDIQDLGLPEGSDAEDVAIRKKVLGIEERRDDFLDAANRARVSAGINVDAQIKQNEAAAKQAIANEERAAIKASTIEMERAGLTPTGDPALDARELGKHGKMGALAVLSVLRSSERRAEDIIRSSGEVTPQEISLAVQSAVSALDPKVGAIVQAAISGPNAVSMASIPGLLAQKGVDPEDIQAFMDEYRKAISALAATKQGSPEVAIAFRRLDQIFDEINSHIKKNPSILLGNVDPALALGSPRETVSTTPKVVIPSPEERRRLAAELAGIGGQAAPETSASDRLRTQAAALGSGGGSVLGSQSPVRDARVASRKIALANEIDQSVGAVDNIISKTQALFAQAAPGTDVRALAFGARGGPGNAMLERLTSMRAMRDLLVANAPQDELNHAEIERFKTLRDKIIQIIESGNLPTPDNVPALLRGIGQPGAVLSAQ